MASKRRLRRRSCGNKIPHTEEKAHAHAFALGLDRYHAYKCSFCPSWHVGRKPGK